VVRVAEFWDFLAVMAISVVPIAKTMNKRRRRWRERDGEEEDEGKETISWWCG
jgi:hypothetical protein